MMLNKYAGTLLGCCFCAAFAGANAQVGIAAKDTDYDGLSDQQEEVLGTDPWLSDTDGDGIKDAVEVGESVDAPLNADNDQWIDALDIDDDGDGVPTILEGRRDTDGDGIMDYLDLNSDGDDRPDQWEAGISGNDTDNDGLDDYFDVEHSGGEDENGDGVDDHRSLPDSDADGIPDIQDKDDREGAAGDARDLVKSEEKLLDSASAAGKAQEDRKDLSYSQEKVLDGGSDARDTDKDGISDALEKGLDPTMPVDTDGDGLPDFRDEDDDGDGVLTRIEGEGDRDGDGRVNYLDVDPGGYFYCAGNGRIVKGIRQFKVFPKESVDIMEDGRKGIISWKIRQPGTYSLQFVLPKGLNVLPKSDNGQLYVTRFNGDLISLGRSEDIGRQGYLANFDPDDLPGWYSTFAIQEGAPPIVNLNIPLVGGSCEK